MSTPNTKPKTNPGNHFEDFAVGQEIVHATPRTVNEGDIALYQALYGSRFPINSAATFAMDCGLEDQPVDDLLAFHLCFGKSVPDISLNAVANLGYADGRFGVPLLAGDTVTSVSKVIGLKENSNGKTGVVYVRTSGLNQRDEMVVDYVRWVMVRKKDPTAPAPETEVPNLPEAVAPEHIVVPDGLDLSGYNLTLAGSPHLWEDYAAGEKIDHVDAMTIEEAEHMSATRLYQNTAKVHFNQHEQAQGRFGKRLIYGGHVISLARALSFNGLANAFKIAAINAGAHANPTFAGDTIYAWTEVLEKMALPGRTDCGALRLRTVGVKNRPCADFPLKDAEGKYESDVVLDFDYTVLMPRQR